MWHLGLVLCFNIQAEEGGIATKAMELLDKNDKEEVNINNCIKFKLTVVNLQATYHQTHILNFRSSK